MKLPNILRKLLQKFSLRSILGELLTVYSWDKLILALSNECVYRAQAAKKQEKREWYNLARLFHHARDGMVSGKETFKIIYKTICQCKKCERRFQVDFGREANCNFDLARSAVVITCPSCGEHD